MLNISNRQHDPEFLTAAFECFMLMIGCLTIGYVAWQWALGWLQ